MPTLTFDPSEGPTPEEQAAQQAALEQGEKLIQAQEEDKARRFEENQASNEDVSLIAGKFKSQEDLIKAYEELQRKLGNPEASDEESEEDVEPTEERVEEEAPEEEVVEEAVQEAYDYMQDLGKEYQNVSDLPPEAFEKLQEMDSKDLVKAYLKYSSETQAAALQQGQVNEIMQTVGGQDAYQEIVSWASTNLPESEVAEFNAVTQTNNPVAIKFAVQALKARYDGAVGYEAPLVTGRKAASQVKGFRSQAELARAIADPRYSTDPAYRQDVEQKLSRSGDLL